MAVLKRIAPNSIASVVSDPPYELGFMGQRWDSTGIANNVELWKEVLRVLKPGGHLVAFSGTRTYHRMACAIEDAGFEVRDMLAWLHGSGFPKSRDILKPALEPVCLARKPLSEKTVAANILRWGTGALNIGDCHIDAPEGVLRIHHFDTGSKSGYGGGLKGGKGAGLHNEGRWPANVIHDGSDEVVSAFPVTDDSGSSARFYYHAKADKYDRAGSEHSTVKPVDVKRWLVRLITPPHGTVLDPFAGTGTTGEASALEGFRVIMIERELNYQIDIRRRMARLAKGENDGAASKKTTRKPAAALERR